jgi:hypothetical protein
MSLAQNLSVIFVAKHISNLIKNDVIFKVNIPIFCNFLFLSSQLAIARFDSESKPFEVYWGLIKVNFDNRLSRYESIK